jgi:hypothetical protein
LNNNLLFAYVLVTIGFFAILTFYSPITTNALNIIENSEDNAKHNEKLDNDNKYIIQKSCGNSFLSKNEGGLLSPDVLSDLNSYLSHNPVAIGDEPLTNVKNVDGLCVLINLIESENTDGRAANEEQIRNIFNAALQEKSNHPIIKSTIDNLLTLGLIEPSDD